VGTIYDPKTSQSRGIGDDVTSIFSGNKIIQQSMGTTSMHLTL
jgi:hypothetical protein